MFFTKNGRTNTRAQLLSAHNIPRYLILGHLYEILVPRKLESTVQTADGDTSIWSYLISDTRTGKTYYIHTPHTLPMRFWVRAVTGELVGSDILGSVLGHMSSIYKMHYEILDENDDITPIQALRDRAPTLERLPGFKVPIPSTT